MANTYTQLYVHLVFVVKDRWCLLTEKQRPEIFKYISRTITRRGHKAIIVNGVGDHVHLVLGLNPAEAIADLVREVKKSSSTLINNKGYIRGHFHWQEGYGGFTYSRSQLDNLYHYVLDQENHHKKFSFKEEYLKLLQEYNVEYEPQYLFNFDL